MVALAKNSRPSSLLLSGPVGTQTRVFCSVTKIIEIQSICALYASWGASIQIMMNRKVEEQALFYEREFFHRRKSEWIHGPYKEIGMFKNKKNRF